MSIRTVISDLGGITAVARELGHKHPSTVQGWWEREVIPARQQPRVIDLGQRLRVPIDPAALIPQISAE